MLYTEIFRSDLRRPQPVEPDPCTRIVARRGNYLSYLRRRVSDPDTAEDLLQDFNLKVIRASRRDGMEPDLAEADSADGQLTDIEQALARIRPDQAELIRGLYLRDQTRDSLARQLNVSIGTLNVRILRARRALRDALTGPSGHTGAIGTAAGSNPDFSGFSVRVPGPHVTRTGEEGFA
jgi:DNA-directed RNA polymerase specialized sigma24 family protein